MKKVIIYPAALLVLFAASCKETVIPVSTTDDALATDTTYVDPSTTPPQARRQMIEELSGVTCVNCPGGSTELKAMEDASNGTLSVVSVHTGTFTDPIDGKDKNDKDVKSIQNFQTDEGRALREQVWGGQGNKPTAIFDRLPLGTTGSYSYFVDGVPGWNNALIQDKAAYPTTPVNITVTSEYKESKGTYDIEVTVKYTEEVTGKHALHLFLTESKIIDVQELSSKVFDEQYEFNHILRKYITPVATGRLIETGTGSDLKEKGRVYIYRNSLKIDKSDQKQSYWKPENMKIIAFVTDNKSASDKRVMHVMETDLSK